METRAERPPSSRSLPASHGWCHLHLRERGSPMKNRKREICTSGSVRDEDGQPPHLLGRRTFLHLAASAAALPTASRFAWAQTYPSRPMRWIVPAAAGSGHDIVVRLRSRLGRARHDVKTDDRARVTPSAKSRENIRRPCRGKVSLSELGWPNLLLRDKLPTGNE